MNPIMMTNAQFYFALGVPLIGILVNIAAITILGTMLSSRISSVETMLGSRISSVEAMFSSRIAGIETMVGSRLSSVEDRLVRLEDRVHTGQDLLIGKMGELDARIVRLEERLPR
jgi:hypothetical protein